MGVCARWFPGSYNLFRSQFGFYRRRYFGWWYGDWLLFGLFGMGVWLSVKVLRLDVVSWCLISVELLLCLGVINLMYWVFCFFGGAINGKVDLFAAPAESGTTLNRCVIMAIISNKAISVWF